MPCLRHVAGGLALLAVLAVAPAATHDAAGQEAAAQAWLFVLQGELTEISDSAMSLRPDPQVVAFTDRPQRLARLIDVPTLASAWGDGETAKADPPNASLVNEADGEIGVIEITDLSGDATDVTVTFRRLDGTLPAVGDRIALTIDGLGSFDYKKLLNLKTLKSLKSL